MKIYINGEIGTSSQDGGIGRLTSPSRTTIRRITTNLKTKNKNCQKIELYGNLTTKDFEKNHSPTQLGGAENGNQGGEDSVWHTEAVEAGRMGGPTFTSG